MDTFLVIFGFQNWNHNFITIVESFQMSLFVFSSFFQNIDDFESQ